MGLAPQPLLGPFLGMVIKDHQIRFEKLCVNIQIEYNKNCFYIYKPKESTQTAPPSPRGGNV